MRPEGVTRFGLVPLRGLGWGMTILVAPGLVPWEAEGRSHPNSNSRFLTELGHTSGLETLPNYTRGTALRWSCVTSAEPCDISVLSLPSVTWGLYGWAQAVIIIITVILRFITNVYLVLVLAPSTHLLKPFPKWCKGVSFVIIFGSWNLQSTEDEINVFCYL